jgi:predicted RecB family nuclease
MPVFGFAWRDEDPGGLQSQLWLAEARSANDPEVAEQLRIRIVRYNQDDVSATAALRDGPTSSTSISMTYQISAGVWPPTSSSVSHASAPAPF